MGTHRRWSKEAKLAILEEAERNGIAQTSRKHGIAASQVHDWKKKFQLLGEAGLSGYVPKEEAETQRLRLENQALKEMIAFYYKPARSTVKRQWVKDLVPNPAQPLTHLEFDIKYMYMHIHCSRRCAATMDASLFPTWCAITSQHRVSNTSSHARPPKQMRPRHRLRTGDAGLRRNDTRSPAIDVTSRSIRC